MKVIGIAETRGAVVSHLRDNTEKTEAGHKYIVAISMNGTELSMSSSISHNKAIQTLADKILTQSQYKHIVDDICG